MRSTCVGATFVQNQKNVKSKIGQFEIFDFQKCPKTIAFKMRRKWFGPIFGNNVECVIPGDHDDAGGPLLPHHAPEVADGRLRRALRHDVGLRLRQTLTKEG